MGYYLQAFIGRQQDLQLIQSAYPLSNLIYLGQGISLIPMTESVFDQINQDKISENIFEYLTTNVEIEVLKRIGDREIAYIEAEYFGGEGGQVGIIWKDGHRYKIFPYGQDVINEVLRLFKVKKGLFKTDEFETLNLNKHRNSRDWIDDTK